ncbi:MAG: PKD domain-containing protein, partial [Vicinamibacteria bacterium]
VVLLYKNDTWATKAGWSGPMSATSPVHSAGSFIALGDTATLVLKSGNLPGIASGTYFDDVVVRGEKAPPPPPSNRPPSARAVASPLSGPAPLTVSFDGSGSSDTDGDSLSFAWNFGDGARGAGAQVSHTFATAGTYTVTLAVDDGRGGTASAITSIAATAPPPPMGLLVNGDFSRGLEGWSFWRERGSLSPLVENGRLRLAASGHNGGVYQQFSTGGSGREFSIDGFWATGPTAARAQWAEVLVINGGRRPTDGQDVNANQPDVVLVYKNDTWASPSGWSGLMSATSPVVRRGSFVAASDVATIVLKSGNLLGVNSGTNYDDIVVSAASPPPSPPPTATPAWDPRLSTLGLEVVEA